MADPVAAPAEIAEHLAQELPRLLSERLEDDRVWHVEVHCEQLPPSDDRRTEMMDVVGKRMRQHGWNLAACITDYPLRSGQQPIVADVSLERRVLVVSLPALGGMALHRRVRGLVSQLITDMFGRDAGSKGTEKHRRRRLPWLFNRFQWVTPEHRDVDVRVLASRGVLRLLIGMVRDNRPWRLVFGLTGPLVGAFAFSAFYLINTTVWRLASTMELPQLLAAVLGSVAVMVGWLIVYHRLWEQTTERPANEREEAMLFNSSTVLTLAIGVACMYGALYVVNLIAAFVVVTPEVLGEYVGPGLGFGDYAVVVLLVTAAATVAGAVGSGFESENSVREAAFSYRERERRQALHATQTRREQREARGEFDVGHHAP
ncbi:GtrA domain-containing protein [Saccharopolyspora rhizosphaerae]|uniref:hypothetical protein n=1 Tax=Saccharopolyspora rhizosphaerae TaxID=2492662 RepID=UPI001F1C0B5D|nr:hypothetical protein [Saccharopolyspora rhizosphaerae]